MVHIDTQGIEKSHNTNTGQEHHELEGFIVQFEVQRSRIEDGSHQVPFCCIIT